jgi:putative hydrolase of the HAD superfamily
MNTENIKAILFDAGDTLTRPASGNWFVPVNYMTFFQDKLGRDASTQGRQAFQIAYAYLNEHHQAETEEEEYTQFVEFYRIFLTEYGFPDITDELLSTLAHYMVYDDDKFVFFDDTFTVIPKLFEHFTLGIVSNTWPSLDRVFRNQQLRHYFDTFVMSSVLGVYKPHTKMYTTALDELQLAPEETIFVDDSVKNLEGAARLGMQAVLIDRYNQHAPDAPYPRITALHGLAELLDIPEL